MTTSLEERARELLKPHCTGSDDHDDEDCHKCEQMAKEIAAWGARVQAEARLDGMITQLKAVAGYLPPSEYGHRLRELERRLAQAAALAKETQ